MPLLPEQLVRQIHAATGQIVLALNGGSRAVAELLEVPGGSKTVLEAVVPYSEGAITAWIGSRPEQACSSRTARAMGVVAFGRAIHFGANELQAAGVACTASLSSDRPKRGPHRCHIAMQTADTTAHWSLELEKGARNRREEEDVVSRMVLNAVATACGVEARLDLPLVEKELVETERIAAPPSWQDLFLGRVEMTQNGGEPPSRGWNSEVGSQRVILAGAFDPLHVGHRRMAEVAAEMLGLSTAWEISILNVDKPTLDYLEIDRRLAQFRPEELVWLTRAATFEEKSRLFPGTIFVVGVDTLQRIVDPRYYGNHPLAMKMAIEQFIARNCRFLVFCRELTSGLIRLADISLPFSLRRACTEIPPEKFREDVSSTAIRKEGEG